MGNTYSGKCWKTRKSVFSQKILIYDYGVFEAAIDLFRLIQCVWGLKLVSGAKNLKFEKIKPCDF
jgi:hypothetical protein